MVEMKINLKTHTEQEIKKYLLECWVFTDYVIFHKLAELNGYEIETGKGWRNNALKLVEKMSVKEVDDWVRKAEKVSYDVKEYKSRPRIDKDGYIHLKRYEWSDTPYYETEINPDEELKKLTNTWRQSGHGVYFCPENLQLESYDDIGAGGWYGEMCQKFGKPKRTIHAKVYWKDMICVDKYFIKNLDKHRKNLKQNYGWIMENNGDNAWSPFTHYVQLKLHQQNIKKVIYSGALDFVSLYPEKFKIIKIERSEKKNEQM
jgi:hypothetical protein